MLMLLVQFVLGFETKHLLQLISSSHYPSLPLHTPYKTPLSYEGKNGHYSRCMRPSVGLIYATDLGWQRHTPSSLRTSPSARESLSYEFIKSAGPRLTENPTQGYVSAKLLKSDEITVNWDPRISKYLTATLEWVWACESGSFAWLAS